MSAAAGRKVTEVAVGVLLRADGAVLLADRPEGKPYAGYWEFPGGKVEPSETIEQALARELHEELGIDIGPALPWVTFEFDYPHAYVRLHFCRVYDWHGTPASREGQNLRFFSLADDAPRPLLPAAVPALRWLRLPTVMAEARIGALPAERLLPQIEQALAGGLRLLLLRADGDPAQTAGACVADIVTRASAFGAEVVVEHRLQSVAPGLGAGVHGAGAGVRAARTLSDGGDEGGEGWRGADASTRAAVERAAAEDCDYVIAGPVLPDPASQVVAAAIGWHGLAQLTQAVSLPVFAAGGLARSDLARAQHAGAHGIVLPLAEFV
jgi:8-oxo-dGTP diphosphatase